LLHYGASAIHPTRKGVGFSHEFVIIMAYCQMDEMEASCFKPTVVFVNSDNSLKEVTNYERHGEVK